jgi:hypothetical protein
MNSCSFWHVVYESDLDLTCLVEILGLGCKPELTTSPRLNPTTSAKSGSISIVSKSAPPEALPPNLANEEAAGIPDHPT